MSLPYVFFSSQNFFLICGLSRLSARVARALVRDGHAVSVIAYEGDKASLRMILPPAAQVYNATAENAAEVLAEAGIESAACMLALSEDDMANLRSTVSARSIVADVPVVMRAFDPLLADHFEKSFGVRRAYSVSSLAAPAFIAAAAGAEMIGSLRLGHRRGAVLPVESAGGLAADRQDVGGSGAGAGRDRDRVAPCSAGERRGRGRVLAAL